MTATAPSRGKGTADVMRLMPDEPVREDAALVGLIEEWEAVRARLRLYYADASTGTTEDLHRMIDQMLSLEARVTRFHPGSMIGARKLLSMASDILAERIRDPDSLLGDGPALELVSRVGYALPPLGALS